MIILYTPIPTPSTKSLHWNRQNTSKFLDFLRHIAVTCRRNKESPLMWGVKRVNRNPSSRRRSEQSQRKFLKPPRLLTCCILPENHLISNKHFRFIACMIINWWTINFYIIRAALLFLVYTIVFTICCFLKYFLRASPVTIFLVLMPFF